MGSASIMIRKTRSAWVRARRLVVSQRFGVSPSAIYDEAFYRDSVDANEISSAPAVMDAVCEFFQPQSIFDVGCGNGVYLREAAKRGLYAAGCDGSSVGVGLCPAGVLAFQFDLRKPLKLNRQFDVCLCFEVAEHIPIAYSKRLIGSLGAISGTVLFSTPEKGEGGIDHINEQPPEFWARLFALYQLHEDCTMTARLRERFQSENVVQWLTKHIRVFRRDQDGVPGCA